MAHQNAHLGGYPEYWQSYGPPGATQQRSESQPQVIALPRPGYEVAQQAAAPYHWTSPHLAEQQTVNQQHYLEVNTSHYTQQQAWLAPQQFFQPQTAYTSAPQLNQAQLYRPQDVQLPTSGRYYQPAPTHPPPYHPVQPLHSQSHPQSQRPRPQHPSMPQSDHLNPSVVNSPLSTIVAPPNSEQRVLKQGQEYGTAAPQTVRHRAVAHVAIPVSTEDIDVVVSEMPRAQKRRKSNDGIPVPIRDSAPRPQKSTKGVFEADRKPKSALPSTESRAAQAPSTPSSTVDYQAVLLALSDEYVSAAYSMTTSLAEADFPEDGVNQFHQLMSTGMSCLSSALHNYEHPDPRKEAQIRLRLASLMLEETENAEGIEQILTKGIALCERHRMVDLRYAMHHMLVRSMAKSSIKAASKAVEKLAAEATTVQQVHWVYAFHLLRVSLGFSAEGNKSNSGTLKSLAAVSSVAHELSDVAVQIIVATLEVMWNLRSGAADAVDLAQRALATARMHQLSPEMQALPQIRILLDCLDLAIALVQCNHSQINQKLQALHANIDTTTNDAAWTQDDVIYIITTVRANGSIGHDTAGLFACTEDARAALKFDWLRRSELYGLAYMLSGVASSIMQVGDLKSEKYLNEGLKQLRTKLGKAPTSMGTVVASKHRRSSMETAVRLNLAFARCVRSDWKTVHAQLEELKREMSRHDQEDSPIATVTVAYLTGVCKQALADLDGALEEYCNPELAFSKDDKDADAVRMLKAVASLNRILILRHRGYTNEANEMLAMVESYCLAHPNKALVAAHHIVKATDRDTNRTTIGTKHFLQLAVQTAKTASNNPLLCIIMNLMTQLFFTGIMVDQAISSARASRTLALKNDNKLWTAVADRMYCDTLELYGKPKEAALARKEAAEKMDSLPEALKECFYVNG